MGMVEGNIIATIMATHMPVNINAECHHDPMGIQAIDIVQPPGMVMPPDIVRHPYHVAAAAAVNATAETAYRAVSRRWAARISAEECAAMGQAAARCAMV